MQPAAKVDNQKQNCRQRRGKRSERGEFLNCVLAMANRRWLDSSHIAATKSPKIITSNVHLKQVLLTLAFVSSLLSINCASCKYFTNIHIFLLSSARSYSHSLPSYLSIYQSLSLMLTLSFNLSRYFSLATSPISSRTIFECSQPTLSKQAPSMATKPARVPNLRHQR